LARSPLPPPDVYFPSLAIDAGGVPLLLWEEGPRSGRWLLSSIQGHRLAEPLTELAGGSKRLELNNDSLWAWVYQPDRFQNRQLGLGSHPTATLEIREELNTVWRADGLVRSGEKVLAVWSSADAGGMQIREAEVESGGEAPKILRLAEQTSEQVDVTKQIVVLSRTPQFDSVTGTLSACISIGNRGTEAIETPINVEVVELRSPAAQMSVLNSTNGLSGIGATWDISGSITGDRIPPRTSSHPFCLKFRAQIPPEGLPAFRDELLDMKFRVFSRPDKRLGGGNKPTS
jgi:hypothetical protein